MTEITIRGEKGLASWNKLNPIWERKVTLFNSPAKVSLSSHTTCGEVLDFLIGAILSRPSYIRGRDVNLYAAMLLQFKDHVFTFSEYRRKRGYVDTKGPVHEAPFGKIDLAFRDWVESYLRSDEHHPILSTYALMTAELVEAHVCRDRSYKVMLNFFEYAQELVESRREGFRFLQDSSFKAQFTRMMGLPVVEIVVPDDASINFNIEGKKKVEAGEKVYFVPERCHLSMGWGSDTSHFTYEEQLAPETMLVSEPCFWGAIVPAAVEEYGWASSFARPRGEIPVRWVIGVMKREKISGVRLWEIPDWVKEN